MWVIKLFVAEVGWLEEWEGGGTVEVEMEVDAVSEVGVKD